ncbi:MAG: UvrD-helicase domain-containing protein, partial [Longimicrobiales bacterium]
MTPIEQAVLDDQASREVIRGSLDESLIVEASAGAGKTYELVQRIVAMLAAGRAQIDQIVAVTFTRKAAGELKLRLRQELDRARRSAKLDDALARLEEARIGTIHSFCADILRERPVEAVVDPAFEELSEVEAPRLYRRAFGRWLEHRLAEPSPALRRALSRLAVEDASNGTPVERLREAGFKLIEWRDFDAPWSRPPFDREAEIGRLVDRLRNLARLALRCTRTNDGLKDNLRPVAELAASTERAEAVRPRDYDSLEGLLLQLPRVLKKNFR